MHIATISYPSKATFLHRNSLPFKWLAVDHPQHKWTVSTSDQITGSGITHLWLYGTLRNLSDWGRIARLKRRGIRLVYTHDDSVWHHPDWRTDGPTEEHVLSVETACELADLIVPSTAALAEVIGKPLKTVVAPNLLEVQRYQTPTPPDDDGVIRILWAGAGGHWADLQLIDAACCRIKEKWGPKVRFHFLGDIPDQLHRDWLGDGVALTDWYPLSEHWYRLNQIRPHIVLAPLADCTFNQCKSNIRILEGWSLNAAVIHSPVGEYAAVTEDSIDAVAADSEGDWFGAMDFLIGDRTERERLAVAGYRKVRAGWDWQEPAAREKWKPVVDRLGGLQAAG